LRPDDARAQCRAGRIRTLWFREAFFRRLRNDIGVPIDQTRLWKATSPAILYADAQAHLRAAGPGRRYPMRDDPLVRRHLQPALQHYRLARRACPLMARVHLRLAELAFLSDDPARDAACRQRARELAPSDPDLLYQCGLLELHAGRHGMAFADWRRSLSLTPRHLGEMVHWTGDRLSTQEFIDTIVPPLPAVLVKLAEEHYASEEFATQQLVIVRRAETLLDECPIDQPERFRLRGKIHALQSQGRAAIDDYQQALLLQSDNIELRYDLARLLAAEGDYSQARHHAAICAYLSPRNQRYRTLLESLDSH
jgi:tetratricopeptide (TPR) repeat protein